MSDRSDPILQVCGVAAEQLLKRIATRREGRGTAFDFEDLLPSQRASFLDFSMNDDAEFVRQMYIRLLRRRPDPTELAGRMSDIAHGTTRAAILFRVMLSPEGRQAAPAIKGILLPAFRAVARFQVRRRPATEFGQSLATRADLPALDGGKNIVPPLLLTKPVSPLRRAYRQIRKIPLLGATVEVALDLTRLRRLRYEVIELRREIERLRARSGP